MNLHYAHIRLRVVSEEHLRICKFLAFVSIVRTTINLSSVLCAYREVVWDVYAVVHQLCLEVLVKELEVDTFFKWLL